MSAKRAMELGFSGVRGVSAQDALGMSGGGETQTDWPSTDSQFQAEGQACAAAGSQVRVHIAASLIPVIQSPLVHSEAVSQTCP